MNSAHRPWQHHLGFAVRMCLLWALAAGISGCGQEEPDHVVDFDKRSTQRVVSPTSSHHGESDEIFLFGFDPRASLQEDARQYQPLLDYLEDTTGHHFHLALTSKGERLDERIGRGEVHFGAVGAVTQIKLQERYGARPVVRGLNAMGKATYQSVIVVLPDSPLQKVEELRGKRFAFGHVDSTQGHLIPRIVLLDHGLELKDLDRYRYLGSHRECANGVISRRFDACGMQDTMGRQLEASGLLRIMYTSADFPSSGIAASPSVAPEIVEDVRRALIRFDPKGRHAEGLHNWDRTEMPNGFTNASAEDYRPLRDWMIHLGLLEAKEDSE